MTDVTELPEELQRIHAARGAATPGHAQPRLAQLLSPDSMGGLDAAIKFAAEKAGLGNNYRLTEYPRQKELLEAIQEFLEGAVPRYAHSTGLSAKIAQTIESELKMLRSFNDPNGIYLRMPLTLNLR